MKCCMCFSNCSEGDLQLDNSTSPPLVMMCVQRQWGYICGRQAANSPWTQENVGVACQQLGFVREGIKRTICFKYKCIIELIFGQ